MKETLKCRLVQLILLVWFFLDMTGLSFDDKCLVTQSYKDDGLFFIIYSFSDISSEDTSVFLDL